MGFFYIVVIVVILGGGIIYSYYRKMRQEEAWRNTAKRLNLQFDEGGWFSKISMRGTYRKKRLEIRHETERRGGGKNSRTVHFAAIEASLEAPCWRSISLSPHGLVDSVAKFFGGQDREVGDSSFDSDFRIKGRMNGKIRQCLKNSAVQSTIRGISRSYGSFKLEQGRVCIRERGLFTCESELTRMIERIIDVAEELDTAAGVGDPTADDANDDVLFPDYQSQQPAGETPSSPIW